MSDKEINAKDFLGYEVPELKRKLSEAQKELMLMRFQKKVSSNDFKISKFQQLRKVIARIMTVIKAKEINKA